MNGMASQVTVKQVDDVPEDACVCHFDELEERGQHRFAEAVKSLREQEEAGELAADTAVSRCDIVKFTEYYLLERS